MRIAEDCHRRRKGNDWCRMSPDCEGWKCRCLLCIPDRVPETEQEKSQVFVKVYKMAQDAGVLQCPCFKESSIDETLDNPSLMESIVSYGSNFRTVLLSKNNNEDTNPH